MFLICESKKGTVYIGNFELSEMGNMLLVIPKEAAPVYIKMKYSGNIDL